MAHDHHHALALRAGQRVEPIATEFPLARNLACERHRTTIEERDGIQIVARSRCAADRCPQRRHPRAYRWRAESACARQSLLHNAQQILENPMKRLCELSSIGCALLIATTASAQQNQPAPTPLVEIFPCTYRGDNDIDNLRTVATRFNTWADRNGLTNYTAFLATPYAYSADLEADVLWIGGWPNGAAMGTEETRWLAEGGEISAAFDAVVDCTAHSLYAEVVINQPAGPTPQNPVAMFQDCTVHENRTVPEVMAAAEQWAEYTKANGAEELNAMLFPLAGLAGDADYDFKVVTGFDSMQAFGKATDVYTGGGFMRGEELFGRLVTCNSARIYTLDRVRLAAATPSG
jgi:hypothetical protein